MRLNIPPQKNRVSCNPLPGVRVAINGKLSQRTFKGVVAAPLALHVLNV
jgi:hypothetical protein